MQLLYDLIWGIIYYKASILNFDTSNVTDMSYMFCNCSSLKELNLTRFNTSKVTNMYFMFYKCSALSQPYLYNFNIHNIIIDSISIIGRL